MSTITAIEIVEPTEGPWIVVADGEANVYTVLAGANWLMSVRHNGHQLVAKQEANMRAVAAAPELLAALREIERIAPSHIGHIATTAIAKAGGIQS